MIKHKISSRQELDGSGYVKTYAKAYIEISILGYHLKFWEREVRI
ncbi:hypothetical protein ACFO26_02895 [Lactococcus nasutitermitis]|uniref:Uncharacterized protein n=1 Tax=Lactococcus nasutitermitis TaxID=1652957 RepID=A0ABV9JBF3_9LACT|nr:hypothetical protein [Lactococcus nasutitermitis]